MKGEKAMKKFETPEVEVTTFAVEDVITASGGIIMPDKGENDTDWN